MKEFIKIAELEIMWHEQNKIEAPSKTAAKYFIRGMIYLLDLYREAQSMEEDD